MATEQNKALSLALEYVSINQLVCYFLLLWFSMPLPFLTQMQCLCRSRCRRSRGRPISQPPHRRRATPATRSRARACRRAVRAVGQRSGRRAHRGCSAARGSCADTRRARYGNNGGAVFASAAGEQVSRVGGATASLGRRERRTGLTGHFGRSKGNASCCLSCSVLFLLCLSNSCVLTSGFYLLCRICMRSVKRCAWS